MSWTEVQALGTRAAAGAGVPAAQSLAFGATLARHLADGGAEAPVFHALDAPDSLVRMAHRIERIVEQASLSPRTIDVAEPDGGTRALLVSWLAALPCQAEIATQDDQVRIQLALTAPSTRSRPQRVEMTAALTARLTDLAARTYVPDSAASRATGAGAGLMELD